MKTSTYSGHVSVNDDGRTVLIWEGVQYDDDHEAVQARPELFETVKAPTKRTNTKSI